MEIKGKVKVVNLEQVISEKFKKRELVVTTNDTYPQDILIQFIQDKCNLLDNLLPGDEITVHFNLRGREWVDPKGGSKYYNTIEGWKIDK